MTQHKIGRIPTRPPFLWYHKCGGQIISQSRLGRPQNLATQCNTTEKRKASHTVAPFGVAFRTPFLENEIFFRIRSAFLRVPVSGSVLGSVLTFIFNRKVFENKAEETREREES